MKTLDEIGTKLDGGQLITYDDAADLFAQTATGQATMHMNGIDRSGMLALLKARFPTEAALTQAVAAMKGQLDALRQNGPRH